MPDEQTRKQLAELHSQHATEAVTDALLAATLAVAQAKDAPAAPLDFTPNYDRILIRKTDAPNQANFGFAVPEAGKEKPTYGEVLAIGPGYLIEQGPDAGQLIPLRIKVGDRVAIGKYTGTDIKIDGKEYSVLRENEVLGVLGPVKLKSLREMDAEKQQGKLPTATVDKRPDFLT